MMKKISKAFCAFCVCAMVAISAGCGQGDQPKDITVNSNAVITDGSQSDAEKVSDKENEVKQESEALKQEGQKEEKGAFGFLYEGVTLIPGEVFEPSVLGEYSDVSEVPSCAFDGNDRVYNYGMFELTAYIDGEEERIYSIYFLDPNLSTTEGLRLGDTVDDMKSFYGEDYEMFGTSYDYTGGDTVLSIIVNQNDAVMSIEYRLNR